MPTTAPPRPAKRAASSARATAPAAQRQLPGRVRERRPALAALGILLVVGGALGSALVVHRSGDRVDVLIARHDSQPGEKITSDDLGIARIATDGAAVVPAGARANFVGTYATTRIPADTLLNRTMFLANGSVPEGAAVVGVFMKGDSRLWRSSPPG